MVLVSRYSSMDLEKIFDVVCVRSQEDLRYGSRGTTVSSGDDSLPPLLDRNDTERLVHQNHCVDLLVYGNIDDTSLDIFVNQPSTLVTSPVFAFIAPITSFQALLKCLWLVTEIDPKSGHFGQHPFQIMRLRVSNKYNCSTFIASTGWPDLSGGNTLSLPYLTDIDVFNALQTSLVSQIADCVVIVVEHLTRSEILFLTKFLRRQKWVIIWHNVESTEEFKVCRLIIAIDDHL